MKLNAYIDQTLLRADAKSSDIEALCELAEKCKFFAVCVNPLYVSIAGEYLAQSNVKIATVVGFPLGANTIYTKVEETKKAIDDGADEIDMVMPIGLFKGGEISNVEADIKDVVKAAEAKPVKVIIETGFLDDNEIYSASELVRACGGSFVKTSTGFGPRGASVQDIKIIKSAVGDDCKIKASGGIKTAEFAIQLINAGANRIGTSSGVEIVQKL